MAHLKSCKHCGRIHKSDYLCAAKPHKKYKYKRKAEESGRYTNDWKIKSKDIKRRSGYLCAVCLDEGRFTYDNLETHHIIKLLDRPDLLLEDSNLICLCAEHHEQAERGVIDPDYLRLLVSKRDPPGDTDCIF